jgi:hypothetical protein
MKQAMALSQKGSFPLILRSAPEACVSKDASFAHPSRRLLRKLLRMRVLATHVRSVR